jgi:hypothetical protein
VAAGWGRVRPVAVAITHHGVNVVAPLHLGGLGVHLLPARMQTRPFQGARNPFSESEIRTAQRKELPDHVGDSISAAATLSSNYK